MALLIPDLRLRNRENWNLRRLRKQARHIARQAGHLSDLNEQNLRALGYNLSWQTRVGTAQKEWIPEACAMVIEAARRGHKQHFYEEQILAGLSLVSGGIAEMQTGEGKTLTSLLPIFVHALSNRGCHVITSNDYLAQRDADFARVVLEQLGLTVGCITNDLSRSERFEQYRCHVTYGTANEIGFDYLRDALSVDSGHGQPENSSEGESDALLRVQRELYFALVDEADSVLLDDARTPLLIATGKEPDRTTLTLYQWCHKITANLTLNVDFQIDKQVGGVRLTNSGCLCILQLPKPLELAAFELDRVYRQVEHALTALCLLERDIDYLVRDKEVSLIDPSTGRIAQGRKWQDGLHQAVEVKEGLEPTALTATSARITLQNFFRRYRHVCGLTGTARGAEREFKQIYDLTVTRIPTRRPCQRISHPPRIFTTMERKHQAVVRSIEQCLILGQPVLVGTPSVQASEALSSILQAEKIEHQVLNCRYHEQEAQIIAQAGQPGRVTIATSMAGRGTDIRLTEEISQAGGLHVISTEMQASRRIDLQLVGRSARQGDPGSYQLFLSLEDDLFAELPLPAIEKSRRRLQKTISGELPLSWLSLFRKVQEMLENQHERQRRDLLKWDKEHQRACFRLGLNPLLESIE